MNQKQEAGASGICTRPNPAVQQSWHLAIRVDGWQRGAKQTVTDWHANTACQEENLTVCELGFLADNVHVSMPKNSSDLIYWLI